MPTARAQLMKATRKLMLRWTDASEHWNDPVSNSIERAHIEPLDAAVRSAVGAMESMGELIERARADCS